MMISKLALSSLALVATGVTAATTKATTEVVVAHYMEDLSWISNDDDDDNDVKYTIYSKNERNQPKGSISLSNVGRESQTYLRHIVTNYNNLADWNVFTQGSSPGFGFRPNDQESGHMCSGVIWDDYLHPRLDDGWYEVQTVATRYPEMYHADRFDMMFEIPTSQGNVCPTDFNKKNGWSKWWKEDAHPLLLKQRETNKEFMKPIEFYNHLVVADASDTYYEQFTLNYANGGRFAVSRDRIQSRPLSYYKDLLNALSKDANPIEGYYMETMWYDVFHPEHLQAEYGPVCNDVPPIDNDTTTANHAATSHEIMYTDAIKQYRRTLIDIYGSKASIPRSLMVSSPYFIDTTTNDDDEGSTTSIELLDEIDETSTPSDEPSSMPSEVPSPGPSSMPSEVPSVSFTPTLSVAPTNVPSAAPSGKPDVWNTLLSGTGYCSVLMMGESTVSFSGDKDDKKPTGLYGNLCAVTKSTVEFSGNQAVTGFAKLETKVDVKLPDKNDALSNHLLGTISDDASLSTEIAAAQSVSTKLAALDCDTTMQTLPSYIDISTYKNANKEGPIVICIEKDSKVDSNYVTITTTSDVGDNVVFNIKGKFEVNKAKINAIKPLLPNDIIWHMTGEDKNEVKIAGDDKISGYPDCCTTEIDGSILSVSGKVQVSAAIVRGQIISSQDIQITDGSLVDCHSLPPFYEWPPLASDAPSVMPSTSIEPTEEPSAEPTAEPTKSPMPSAAPTKSRPPSPMPSYSPSGEPSIEPSTSFPSLQPSELPTSKPSVYVPLKNTFTTILQLDNRPNETGFELYCNEDVNARLPVGSLAKILQSSVKDVIEKSKLGSFDLDSQKLIITTSIVEGTVCNVTITDSGGDGMCCDHGDGSYKFYQGQDLFKYGSDDFDSELKFQVTIERPKLGNE